MKVFKKPLICLIIFLCIPVWVFAHEWMAPKKNSLIENPVKRDALSIGLGQTIFSQNCVGCHGEDAKGMNPETSGLELRPPDLTMSIKSHSDGDFFWKIRTGRDEMPSFKEDLGTKEIWSIIHFIHSLGANSGS
jgi:mono/diheme cytochrome c family protein